MSLRLNLFKAFDETSINDIWKAAFRSVGGDPEKSALAIISLSEIPSITRVPASVNNTLIKIANIARLELILFNDSNKDAFVKYGNIATSIDFTVLMPPNSHYFINNPIYTGILYVF